MRMQEIEVKILEVDVPALIVRFEQEGAQKTFEGEVCTVHYEPRSKTKNVADLVLRLRKQGDRATVTLKKRLFQEGVKAMEEYEVNIADFAMMGTILQELGFSAGKEVRKRRASYALADVHFDLDTYTGIPTFLEIEAQSAAIVERWVQRLGYTMTDAKPWSTKELFRHYGIKEKFA